MTATKRVFLILVVASFLFGHLGRMVWPGSLLGRINPLDLVVGLAVLYAAAHKIYPQKNRLLLGFGVVMMISVIWGSVLFGTFNQWEALFYAARLGFYMWFIAIAPRILSSEGWLVGQWIGVVIALVGFLQLKLFPAIPVSFISQYGFDPHNGRLFATFFDPNLVASILILTILMTYGRYERSHQWSTAGALLLQLAALAATASRSGMLGLFVAAVFVLLALRPRWLLGMLAVGMMGIFLSTSLWTRVVGGISIDATSQARFASWETAFQVINPNPITGVGYNFYQSASTAVGRFTPRLGQIALAANASDSSLLTIWATVGIFGLLSLGGWFIGLALPSPDPIGTAVTRGMVAGLLVNSLFINSLLYPFVLVGIALVVASRDASV